MQISSGLPAWTAAPAASGWTELANVVLTSSGTLESGTFAAMDSLYCQIYAAQAGSASNQTVKFNGDNSAIYNWRSQANNGAQSTRTAVTNGIIYLYDTPNSTHFALAQMFISNDADSKKLVVINTTESNGTGNTAPNQEFCWGSFNDTTNQITSIQWGNDHASLTNAVAGSYMKVFGC